MIGLLLMLSVSACLSSTVGINPCIEFRPILVSHSDLLTDGTVSQILEFNEMWNRMCE